MTYSRLAATCLAATLLFAGSLFAQPREIPFDSAGDFLSLPDDIHFGEVAGVATTSTGNLLVYTQCGGPNATIGASRIYTNGGPRLFEFDRFGTLLREIGAGDLISRPYGFLFAEGVRVDAQDNIWTVDRGSTVVIKFDPSGRVVQTFGRRPEAVGAEGSSAGGGGRRGGGGPPGAGSQGDAFNQPTDVAWDAAGNIFVSDGYANARVAKFDKNGNFLKDWGSYGREPGQFNLPHAMVLDRDGNVYVADRNNARIQVFDSNGAFQRMMYLNVPYPANYQPPFGAVNPSRPVRDRTQPWAMCITNTTPQHMWVADNEPGRSYKMALDGKILGWIGSAGRQVGQYN
jgi:hypothetical protein